MPPEHQYRRYIAYLQPYPAGVKITVNGATETKSDGKTAPEDAEVEAVLEQGDRDAEQTMKAEEKKDQEFKPGEEDAAAEEEAGVQHFPKKPLAVLLLGSVVHRWALTTASIKLPRTHAANRDQQETQPAVALGAVRQICSKSADEKSLALIHCCAEADAEAEEAGEGEEEMDDKAIAEAEEADAAELGEGAEEEEDGVEAEKDAAADEDDEEVSGVQRPFRTSQAPGFPLYQKHRYCTGLNI